MQQGGKVATRQPSSQRSRVLWACAILLTAVAGINYGFFRPDPVSEWEREAARSLGIESMEDFRALTALLDAPKVDRLSASQEALLRRYATGPGQSANVVLGILSNVSEDSLARQLIPWVRELRRQHQGNPLADGLPDDWRRRGLRAAAEELLK